jgi:hypothetical protein
MISEKSIEILNIDKKLLALTPHEESTYDGMVEYLSHPQMLDGIKEQVVRYEYSKGGFVGDGIYARSLMRHIFVDNSCGKRCTEKSKYNFKYGFDANNNLIYRTLITDDWIQEDFSIIKPDGIEIYKFDITGVAYRIMPYLNTVTKLSIEDGLITHYCHFYFGDHYFDSDGFLIDSEDYENDGKNIVSIKYSNYVPYVDTIEEIKKNGRYWSTDKIPADTVLSTGKALKLMGCFGMADNYISPTA